MNFAIRPATLEDIPELRHLIAQSARELAREHYSSEQIEAALGSAWGVDSQLIHDQTYFVVMERSGVAMQRSGVAMQRSAIVVERSAVIACGGWSKRKALFGADTMARGEPDLLDPARDSARIRAFFVHPAWARCGIGASLLKKCESEARSAGFRSLELVATLSGQKLYERFGYRSLGARDYPLPEGVTITFVPMKKDVRG